MSHAVCTLSSLAFLAECHFVRHVHFVTGSHGFSLPSLCRVKVKNASLSILWWMTIWAKCIWAYLGSMARTVFVLRVYQSGFSRGRQPVQCIYRKRDLSGWLPWYNLGDLNRCWCPGRFPARPLLLSPCWLEVTGFWCQQSHAAAEAAAVVATAGLVKSQAAQLVTSEAQSRASEHQMCIEFLGLSYLIEHNDLQVHFLQMHVFPLYSWIKIPSCIHTPHFHLLMDVLVALYRGHDENPCDNHGCASISAYLDPFGCVPRSSLAGLFGSPSSSFGGILHWFTTVAIVVNIPTCSVLRKQCILASSSPKDFFFNDSSPD